MVKLSIQEDNIFDDIETSSLFDEEDSIFGTRISLYKINSYNIKNIIANPDQDQDQDQDIIKVNELVIESLGINNDLIKSIFEKIELRSLTFGSKINFIEQKMKLSRMI